MMQLFLQLAPERLDLLRAAAETSDWGSASRGRPETAWRGPVDCGSRNCRGAALRLEEAAVREDWARRPLRT
jgi:hypothetical protein